jgi:signal transduction histidine kinase
VQSGSVAAGQPLRQTMCRLAAAIRGGVALVAVPVAILDSVPPVSPGWLGLALCASLGWAGFFAYTALTRGLPVWLTLIDVLVALCLCLGMRYLVAPEGLTGISSWVANVASLTVICAQLAGKPLVSVPAGLTVAGGFVLGSTLAGAADHGREGAAELLLQTALTATIIAIGYRVARRADGNLDRYHESVRVAEVREAQRADERQQLSHLHNGPLTTLTMAGQGDLGVRMANVRRRAAVDMTALWRGADSVPPLRLLDNQPPVPLDERLRQVAAGYTPPLRLTLAGPRCLVPARVAEGFAEAVGEALENVARHARVGEASVGLAERDGSVFVTVTDRGCGFDPATIPTYRFGLRHGLGGPLAEAGGQARVRSAPGQGAQVILEWPRG